MNVLRTASIVAGGVAAGGLAAYALSRSSDSKTTQVVTPAASVLLGGGLVVAGAIARAKGVGGALAGALQLAGGGIAAGGVAGGILGGVLQRRATSDWNANPGDGSYGTPNPDEAWDADDPVGPDHPTKYDAKSGDLLPNVQPQKPSVAIRTNSEGKRVLEFGTTTGNVGEGPLELRRYQSGDKPIMQVIHNADGSTREMATDRDSFEDGPGSNHLAFNDFARYKLYQVDGSGKPGVEVLRSQYKESFLIIDTGRVDPTIDPEGKHRITRTQDGFEVQGISPGWGDTYGPGLCGQSFDISGLPDGEYVLRQAMDPGNRFVESDESDNVRDTTIRIEGTNATVVKSEIVHAGQ